MKLSILAILLLSLVAKEVSSQACHMREVDLCMAIGMFHYQSNGVPEDEIKLDDFCETLKEVGDCMGNFSSKCMSPLQREMITLFSGADDNAKQLCTAGSDLRTRYLEHGECLAEGAASDTFKEHIRDMQAALESVFEAPFYQRLPGLCCGLKRFERNVEASTVELCGQEAAEMSRYVITMITTDMPNIICQRFDAESDECHDILPPLGTQTKGDASNSQIVRLLNTVYGN